MNLRDQGFSNFPKCNVKFQKEVVCLCMLTVEYACNQCNTEKAGFCNVYIGAIYLLCMLFKRHGEILHINLQITRMINLFYPRFNLGLVLSS